MDTDLEQYAKECVQRGAEMLDVNYPGWVDEMDLDEFDLQDACNCVLGQTCRGIGVFSDGFDNGSLLWWGATCLASWGDELYKDLTEFGFSCETPDSGWGEWSNELASLMDLEWRAQVVKRLGEDRPALPRKSGDRAQEATKVTA